MYKFAVKWRLAYNNMPIIIYVLYLFYFLVKLRYHQSPLQFHALEATMALNDTHPARAVATAANRAGRKRIRIDWKRGAALLIDGETPTAICAALGIDEDRLWRHLRGSLRFQYLLRQARERRRLLGQLKLESVSREAVVRLARSADKPDAMLIAQLAQTAQGEGRGEGGGSTENSDVIARLADSGRRPPNQAFRKRLAVERKQMDAEFESYCRADAARAAQAAAAQAADTSAKPENKTQISENKSGISAEKGAASAEAPVQVERHPHPPADAGPSPSRLGVRAGVRAAPARPTYDHVALGLQNGGIVELTDNSGNPLPPNQDRHART
jgi:hypothetical protein